MSEAAKLQKIRQLLTKLTTVMDEAEADLKACRRILRGE